jgi:anti-sigma factor RsiW
MCPDKQLLSAYCDNEVPSPWKEKIDSHLAECKLCRDIAARYGNLRTALREVETAVDIPGASRRVLAGIYAAGASKPPLWRRRLNLSFATAAAAAVILFGGGIMISLAARNVVENRDIAVRSPAPAENMANIKDMNRLLEILSQRGREKEVTIQLPDVRDFEFRGKPVFLRETEFTGSAKQ